MMSVFNRWRLRLVSMSLKGRLILAIVVLVTLISSMFAITVWQIKTRLEAVAFDRMVDNQLQLFMETPEVFDPGVMLGWSLYHGESLASMPAPLQGLGEGAYHSIRVGDQYFEVAVNGLGQDRFVLAYDITAWEIQENWVFMVMALGILLVLVTAILAGSRAASAVLAPLNALTARLSDIRPDRRGVRLGQQFVGNEVAKIARAFDIYLERLDKFVAREKYFTEAASHELRTPLSVVIGAVEVLESHPDFGHAEAMRRATARIKRACDDMQGFMELSLLMAREDITAVADDDPVNLSQLVRTVVDDQRALLQERSNQVAIEIPENLLIQGAATLIKLVVGNVLRNALEHSSDSTVHISVCAARLLVEDSGEGIAAENMERIFVRNFSTRPDGFGLGLDLVRRVCERFHWPLQIDSEPGRGTRVTIDFSQSVIGSDHAVAAGQLQPDNTL